MAVAEAVERGRKHTSMRLSEESRRLLAALSERLGISRTAVFEVAIREKAAREKVKG